MRREGEGWSFYKGGCPGRPGGATGPPAARGLGPAAGRPWAGRQAPVARWGATGPFFSQGPHCEFEEKKITLKACRPMGGDRGVFLKYFKTDIYF